MSEPYAQQAYGLVLEGEKLHVATTSQPGFFDPRFLIAALLDHVARGDGEVCEEEATAMVELVADHFGLATRDTETSLGHALNLYSRSMDLPTAGEVLCEVLDADERIAVMLMLLQVVAADGRQGADELRAVDEVATCLQLTDQERHAAFQRYFGDEVEQSLDQHVHQR